MIKVFTVLLMVIVFFFLLALLVQIFGSVVLALVVLPLGGLMLMAPFALPFFLTRTRPNLSGESNGFLKMAIGTVCVYFLMSFIFSCLFSGDRMMGLVFLGGGMLIWLHQVLPIIFLALLGLHCYRVLHVPTSLSRFVFVLVFTVLCMFISWIFTRHIFQIQHINREFACHEQLGHPNQRGSKGDRDLVKYLRTTSESFLYWMMPLPI